MHPVNKTLFPSPLISVLLLCKVAGSHIPKYPVTELDTLRWDKANCKPAPATYGRPTPGAQLWGFPNLRKLPCTPTQGANHWECQDDRRKQFGGGKGPQDRVNCTGMHTGGWAQCHMHPVRAMWGTTWQATSAMRAAGHMGVVPVGLCHVGAPPYRVCHLGFTSILAPGTLVGYTHHLGYLPVFSTTGI